MFSRVRTIAVVALAPTLLGGCLMADGLYSGVSVGAGDYGYNPYGYEPYGYPYGYDPYGGYYGGPAYGWYDNYYYPGNGTYVYDRAGRAHHMRAQDRAYWEARRQARAERREERAERRLERREDRLERRQGRIERREARAERRLERQAANPAVIERREARRTADGTFGRGAQRAVERAIRSRQGGQNGQGGRSEGEREP